MFSEAVVIQGSRFKNSDKYKETGGNTGDKANIFGYIIPIMEDRKVEYIILPTCSDIHIFNILIKEK